MNDTTGHASADLCTTSTIRMDRDDDGHAVIYSDDTTTTTPEKQ